jgi:uncharacterized protein HemX
MPTHLALSHTVTEMSTGAATVAISAALALGFYFARWLQAERDEISLRSRLNAAIKVMWSARRALVVVVILVWLLSDLWFRGQGR